MPDQAARQLQGVVTDPGQRRLDGIYVQNDPHDWIGMLCGGAIHFREQVTDVGNRLFAN
jgi:hypothetical protein